MLNSTDMKLKCKCCARYLAGGQSSSAVDVSVEVKGGFGDTAAAETHIRTSNADLGADFSLQTQQELRLRPHTLLTHRCQGGGELGHRRSK